MKYYDELGNNRKKYTKEEHQCKRDIENYKEMEKKLCGLKLKKLKNRTNAYDNEIELLSNKMKKLKNTIDSEVSNYIKNIGIK